MKIGTVDSSGEALVSLTVEGLDAEGKQRDVAALVDTGSMGFGQDRMGKTKRNKALEMKMGTIGSEKNVFIIRIP